VDNMGGVDNSSELSREFQTWGATMVEATTTHKTPGQQLDQQLDRFPVSAQRTFHGPHQSDFS
jgi:hypothetical protein